MKPSATTFDAPIRQQLREATAASHRELDRRLALLDAELTQQRFVAILAAFHGYYAPLEERLAHHAAAYPLQLPDWTALLDRDLAALSASANTTRVLPRCERLPEVDNRASFAGVLYVLEGAALGGQVIARAVRQRLRLAEGCGTAFFLGTGAGTSARWKSVTAWLETEARTPPASRAMVEAACETFRTLTDWLQERGALR